MYPYGYGYGGYGYGYGGAYPGYGYGAGYGYPMTSTVMVQPGTMAVSPVVATTPVAGVVPTVMPYGAGYSPYGCFGGWC